VDSPPSRGLELADRLAQELRAASHLLSG
jgi:hypothetical protein